MRMARKQPGVVHPRECDFCSLEFFGELRFTHRAEYGCDPRVCLCAPLYALDIGREFWIARERLVVKDPFRKHAPFAIALDGDQNVGAVIRLEHPVRRNRGMREADALRRRAAFMLKKRHRHPVGHGIEHGNRNRGAFAGAFTRDQCLQNGLISIHSGGDVADRDADARRRVRIAGHRGKPGLGLDQQVIGFARGVWSVFAVTRDRADDEARVIAAQSVEGKAELRNCSGLEVLHKDIGLRQHGGKHGLVLRQREIEADRFLATIEPHEIGALALCEAIVIAREVSLRTLDLDDPRARIGQPAAAHRRRNRLFERNHQRA